MYPAAWTNPSFWSCFQNSDPGLQNDYNETVLDEPAGLFERDKRSRSVQPKVSDTLIKNYGNISKKF